GFFPVKAGLKGAIARGGAYAPYVDLLWCETARPDLEQAREFAEGIHAQFPGKPLAYNCSPSFNWKRKLDDTQIASFQRELGAMGYRFQFITLAGFHALNFSMFELASGYKAQQMSAYVELPQAEFAAVVTGIAGMAKLRDVGKAGGLSLVYFELVTTFALLIGLLVVNVLKPGVGVNADPATLDTHAIAQYATPGGIGTVTEFLLNIIPATFFGAF